MHDPAEESTERRGSGTRISCRRAYATSEPEPDAAEPTAESAERLVEVAGPSSVQCKHFTQDQTIDAMTTHGSLRRSRQAIDDS